MTASQLAASRVLLDIDQAALQALAVEPALLLEGARPRLLDEWQVAPALWNQVRRAVDSAEQPGQFLLTGFAVPADDASRHTGAGRFAFLRMRPMSMLETGAPSGAVSLRDLFEGPAPSVLDPGLNLQDLTSLIGRGGWPAQQSRSLRDLEWFGQVFESLVIRDLRVYSQGLDGEVFHYRDDYGLEVDAIVQLRDGRWGAFAIKLGEGQVEQAAATLQRFSAQIDTARSGSPAFLAVICGKGVWLPSPGRRCGDSSWCARAVDGEGESVLSCTMALTSQATHAPAR